MPGTGCSVAAILTRRSRSRLRRAGTGQQSPGQFDTFLAIQLERIERITTNQIRRVRRKRRALAAAANDQAGAELELRVVGSVGSEAQPETDPLLKLL